MAVRKLLESERFGNLKKMSVHRTDIRITLLRRSNRGHRI